MAKSRTQIAREHVARIRRKAQAYDHLIEKFKLIDQFMQTGMPESIAAHHIRRAVEAELHIAEKAVAE